MGLITPQEYTDAIRREAGYTDREAGFLYIAAVHSGAFVTRQFAEFRGASQGGIVYQFITKGMTLRHFASFPTRNSTRLYQVCKTVYGILGEPDNRNRRPKQAAMQRLRLIGLDYVLANQDKCFLATEFDKLEYLTSIGATASICPLRSYKAGFGRPGPGVSHYFVEKFPLFKKGAGAGFTFICENSVQSFQTFLDRYMPLMSALPEAELVYVTTNQPIVKRAQEVFKAKLEKQCTEDVDLTTFELEFRERGALERKGFESASTQELKRLRELRQRVYANLYPAWQAEGIAGVEKLLGKLTARKRTGPIEFTAHVMADNYRFL